MASGNGSAPPTALEQVAVYLRMPGKPSFVSFGFEARASLGACVQSLCAAHYTGFTDDELFSKRGDVVLFKLGADDIKPNSAITSYISNLDNQLPPDWVVAKGDAGAFFVAKDCSGMSWSLLFAPSPRTPPRVPHCMRMCHRVVRARVPPPRVWARASVRRLARLLFVCAISWARALLDARAPLAPRSRARPLSPSC